MPSAIGSSYNIPSLPFTGTSGQTVSVKIALVVYTTSNDSARTFTTDITGDFTSEVTRKRATTFKIGIRQIGFDINAQAALGDNKTIAFRSGKCAGRSFAIKTCTYVQATDSWSLEVIRSQDDSLSQWFPNTDYPVRGVETNYGGDEFVLLDIAMPDEYVLAAEMKLLNAAQELLDDVSVERWQYNPEIDAKFMVENDREILPGESMTLMDGQIVDGSSDNATHLLQHGGGYVLTSQEQRILLSGSGYLTSALVDTVVISEGEAAIPTYKVTLLDRKRKSYSEAKGADSISSTPVTKLSSTTTNTATATSKGDTYFTLDDNGNVTLKEQYQNLWVPGWMAAGGVGTGGGGGGGATFLNDLEDVTAPSPSNGQALVYRNGEWVNETVQVSGNYIPLSGSTAITGTLGATGWSITTGGVASVGTLTRSGAILYIGNTNNQGYVWLREDTYFGNAMLMGGTSTSSANAIWTIEADGDATFASIAVNGGTSSGFLKADGSVDTTTYLISGSSYIGTTAVQTTSQAQDLTGIKSIKLSTNASTIKWENNAWHFYGNVYADGWIAAGGIGTGGGGSVSYLDDLTDVNAPSPTNGQALVYRNGYWVNETIQSGGGGTVTSITMNGTSYTPSNGVINLGTVITSLSGYATQTWVTNQGYALASSLSDYLPLTGGTLTGDLRLKDNRDYGMTIRFGDGSYAYITEDTDDHLTIHGDKGIYLSTNSGYGVSADSYIDIGDARIIYDSGAKALHVQNKTGVTDTIGFFADGFVSAGGTAAQTTVSFVTVGGDDTVGGDKTFTGNLTFDGVNAFSSYIDAQSDINVGGDITLTGTLNGITIDTDNYGYGDISLSSRLYVQTTSNDLLLGSGNGKVIVGSHPGSSAIGNNKFYVNGSAIATAWNTSSDRRLKDDITGIGGKYAVDTLMAFKPSTWTWNCGTANGTKAAGFIAQDVESLVPYMVSGEDYKSLNYQMLHAFEVSAIQDHEMRLRKLEKAMEG